MKGTRKANFNGKAGENDGVPKYKQIMKNLFTEKVGDSRATVHNSLATKLICTVGGADWCAPKPAALHVECQAWA